MGKRVMSIPISDTMTEAATALTPGIVVNRWAASRKGASVSPTSASIRANGRLERRHLIQVELEQEAVMPGHAAPQGLDDFTAVGLPPAAHERDELLRIGLARGEGRQDGPAALAHDVREDGPELEVRVLQDLVEALDVRRLLADELL